MTEHDSQLARFLLSVADDEFVLGHRLSDWTTQAPTFEEDLTLASMAQDEMGHGRLWYEAVLDRDLRVPGELAPSVSGSEYDLDDLGLNRAPDARRNSVLVEPKHVDVQRAELRNGVLRGPNGETRRPPEEAIMFEDMVAITGVYHDAERRLVESIRDGTDEDLAGRAEGILNEESFHREHVEFWLDRLTSTEEGRERLTRAFNDHLPQAADLFAFPDEVVDPLVDDGYLARHPAELKRDWTEKVRDRLLDRPIDIDDEAWDAIERPPETNGRRGEHTEELDQLLGEVHSAEMGLAGDHPVTRYRGDRPEVYGTTTSGWEDRTDA